MAATLPDIPLTEDWVNLNTESGFAVGLAFTIHNKTASEIRLAEGTTQPFAGSKDGIILQGFQEDHTRVDVLAGSLDIWARVSKPKTEGSVNVQVL